MRGLRLLVLLILVKSYHNLTEALIAAQIVEIKCFTWPNRYIVT